MMHAAFFAVGALVGGGLATAIASERRRPSSPPALAAVQVGPRGALQMAQDALKYGNPGVCGLFVRARKMAVTFSFLSFFLFFFGGRSDRGCSSATGLRGSV